MVDSNVLVGENAVLVALMSPCKEFLNSWRVGRGEGVGCIVCSGGGKLVREVGSGDGRGAGSGSGSGRPVGESAMGGCAAGSSAGSARVAIGVGVGGCGAAGRVIGRLAGGGR